MSLRWRVDGALLCAAKCEPEEGDTYVDDRLHYQLSVVSRCIIPAADEESSGLWYWVHPDGASPWLRAVPEAALLIDKDSEDD